MSAKKTKTVSISVFRPNGTDVCVVRPGYPHIGNQPVRVEWKNLTADEIDILVADNDLKGNKKHLNIRSNDTYGIYLNPKKNKREEWYPYAIYCHETGNHAQAGSDPEMIVP